jgi:hypothetical protein
MARVYRRFGILLITRLNLSPSWPKSGARIHKFAIIGENDKLATLEYLNRSTNEDFGLFITPSFDGQILAQFDLNFATFVEVLSLSLSKTLNVFISP